MKLAALGIVIMLVVLAGLIQIVEPDKSSTGASSPAPSSAPADDSFKNFKVQ